MLLETLPKIEIAFVGTADLLGIFEPSKFIRNGWLGCLIQDPPRFLWGRFADVDPGNLTVRFVPQDPESLSSLHPGELVRYLDNYWGERVQLSLDLSRSWALQTFRAQDAVAVPTKHGIATRRLESFDPPSALAIPEGWDHEHCAICWETIGCGGHASGWVSPPFTWVCDTCYQAHIVPHSVGFLRDA